MTRREPDIELVLASASPRRRALLSRAGYRARIMKPAVDERPRPGEAPTTYARRLAVAKAKVIAGRLPPPHGVRILVACDTVVAIGRTILGKPRDRADARRMLRRLSGREHSVISGVALLRHASNGRRAQRCFTVVTRVQFRRLNPDEIEDYIATGDPMDKAGAYGIQEGAAHFVRSIDGSVTNVIGLPLAEVVEQLRRWSLRPPGHPRSIVRR